MERRQTLPSRADYEALRRALTDSGLDPDFWHYEDIDLLWARGSRVEQIVKLTRECAADGGQARTA